MIIIWSEQALDDLAELLTYISSQSPQNAELVSERIQDAASLLASMPGLGRRSGARRVRELIIPRTGCVVAYRVTTFEIRVVQVRRGKRPAGPVGA